LHEGNQVADLHAGLRYDARPDPDDEDLASHHDQVHSGKYEGYRSSNIEHIARQILVGDVKPFFFKMLFIESSDNHDTRKVFAHDKVESVNKGLDAFKAWDDNRKEGNDDYHQNPDDQCDCPPHTRAFFEGAHDSQAANKRSLEAHAYQHKDCHPNLVNIIGGAGDERSRGKTFKLSVAEICYFTENTGTDVPGNTGRAE